MKAVYHNVVVVLGGLLLGALSSAEAAAPPLPRLPVVCPVLGPDWRFGPAPYEMSSTLLLRPSESLPVELVVLGTVEQTGPKGGLPTHEVRIEKVLYGAFKGGRARIKTREPGRGIFALSRDPSTRAPSFEVQASYPASEEKAVRALYRTTLEYSVLTAEVVFLGKNVAVRNGALVVEVQRILHGAAELPGRQVLLRLDAAVPGDKEPFYPSPQIYLAHRAADASEAARPGDPPLFRAAKWVPSTEEKPLRAVLAGRDRYPIVLREQDGPRAPCREVVLSGDFAEALDLLGSSLSMVAALAGRKLILQGEGVRPSVVQAIQRLLFRLDEKRTGDHQRLHHLIDVLRALSTPAARKDLRRLLDQCVKHVAAQPTRPALGHKPRYREEDATDVNHALPWLVRAVDEEYLLDHAGPRLRRLGREVRGAWKAEVELALEACRLADRLETRVARQRLLDVKPASAATVALFHQQPFLPCFSPDGKHLATVGWFGKIQVWRTADWSRVAAFDAGYDTSSARFSADGRRLILVEAGSTGVAWYDWRTGKRLRSIAMPHRHDTGALSADGRRMVLASEHRGVEVRDVTTGRLLRSWPIRGYRLSHLEFSPDAKWLLWRQKKERSSVPDVPIREGPPVRPPVKEEPPVWSVAAVEGAPPRVPGLKGKANWSFSPAGRYLVSVSFDAPGRRTVGVHDAQRNFAIVTTRTDSASGSEMVLSQDGKRLVLFDDSVSPPRVSIVVLSLPELKLLSSSILATPAWAWNRQAALSPDGKWLAFAANDWPAPFLFRTDTGERILPSPAHSSRLLHLFFSSGNKVLRTICQEQFVCRWDAATLRLLGRTQVPPSLRILKEADPEGKQLLCQDLTSKKELVLVVVDTQTVKPLRAVVLPGTKAEQRASLYRLDERRVVALTGSRLFEVDHRAGKVLRQRTYDRRRYDSSFQLGRDDSAVDRNTLFAVGCKGMGSSVTLARLDVQTGKVEAREGQTEAAWTSGLVPGQRLLWAAESEQMRILDRETLQTTSIRRLREARPVNVTFTPDGSRYAFFEDRWERSHDFLRQWKQPSPPLIRIHDRKTGKTLGAVPSPTGVTGCRFRPDGRALAVISDDRVTVWDLSGLEK
jgi:WD40 repeat protein